MKYWFHSVVCLTALTVPAFAHDIITTFLPDGRMEPLLWLYHFDAKWNRAFHFRKPIALPAGTTVESSAPLRFALESEPKVPSQGQ